MSFLRMVDVGKIYPGNGRPTVALQGVNLRVERGEFVALLGPSGCGKTTLLHLVAGLEAPTSGEVLLEGQRIQGTSRERSLVFQECALFPWLTALDNVAFGLRLLGMPAPERRQQALALLDSLGLTAFAAGYPHQLSGGMQQRVALARALAVSPRVLLLDEPFAAVDALTRTRLQEDLLQAWQTYQQTILFVTHSVEEALRLADRVVVLGPRPGRVRIEFAPPLPRPRPATALAEWAPQLLAQMEA